MKFGKMTQISPYVGQTVKISIFFQKQDGGGRPLKKNTKIAISQQRIDRSSRNLPRLCKMGNLTTQTVKKFEFPKSKIADGRHFKNRYIILSQQPFD